MLNVGFYGKLPPQAIVDNIVRQSLDHAIQVDPRADILATGFLGDDSLNSNQYSGPFIYRAAQKKVEIFVLFPKGMINSTSTSTYFVEAEEQKTFPGIKPERKWLTVTIIFPKQPSPGVAYDSIIAEVAKLVPRGIDITVYVSTGNKNQKASWQQMRDTDGANIFADYKASSKQLTRRGKILKQFP